MTAHEETDKRLEEMERHLNGIYKRTAKEIEETANAYFKQFKAEDEAKRKLVEAGELDPAEYERWRRTKIFYGKRYTRLKDDIAEQLTHTNETAVAYCNDELPPIYSINYNEIGNGIKSQINGYSFEMVDANTVKELSTKDLTLLPKRKLDIPADLIWNKRKIQAEMLQGILQGEAIGKIASRLRTVTDMNLNSSLRNARTMVTGSENKGRIESMKTAISNGIKVRKQWIATNDKRTRDWHAELQGKVEDVGKPFENAVGKIMYPGDPAAAPANVYNCRCSLGYVIER